MNTIISSSPAMPRKVRAIVREVAQYRVAHPSFPKLPSHLPPISERGHGRHYRGHREEASYIEAQRKCKQISEKLERLLSRFPLEHIQQLLPPCFDPVIAAHSESNDISQALNSVVHPSIL
jgi:hypothetical protein